MVLEKTLSIIKPDAVSKNLIGTLYQHFTDASFKIIAARMVHLTRYKAECFYEAHRDKPFFPDLITFMISAPVMVQVLSGEDAVFQYRHLIGATDPKIALPHTLRARFGSTVTKNVVHGSDSPENALKEIAFFFNFEEIFEY